MADLGIVALQIMYFNTAFDAANAFLVARNYNCYDVIERNIGFMKILVFIGDKTC